MKNIAVLLIISVLFGFKSGQQIDEKKMNRDLEIAKNILETLIKTDSHSRFSGSTIDASYIKDYGVIFSIPEQMVYFHAGPNTIVRIPEPPPYPDFDMNFDFDMNIDIDEEITVEDRKEIEKEAKRAKKEFEKEKKEMEKSKIEVEAALAEAEELHEIYVSSGKSNEIDWEEIMITFLADYADLIGQLKPDEKIVINQNSPYDEMIIIWSGSGASEPDMDGKIGLSVEVFSKDVKAYKAGKINRKEFEKRVVVKKKEPQKKVADLEMFASIFDRYYSRDLSETFYAEGKSRYEVLEGFGAVFHIKVSSDSHGGGLYFYGTGNSWQTDIRTDKTNEDDDTKLYPKFKEDIKSFMLDYGRTIRSLNDDDKVILEILINSCRGCQIPKSLKVSSEISVLKQYDQQKISREKAMAAIEIKEQF